MPSNSTPFVVIPTGKIKCYITNILRNDTPEEHIRQRIARSLVEEYGYSKSDIDFEWVIQTGQAKKRADIVIFEKDQKHTDENILLIVEAKRKEIKPTHSQNGIKQLKSYLAATLNAKYGLWIGSEIKAYEKTPVGKKWEIKDIIDIPFADGKLRIARDFSDLVPATDALKDVFKRCHNYIATNQGGSKEAAFHEFLKITFCKVYDERNSTTPTFYLDPAEQHSQIGQKKVLQRIQEIFRHVCDTYGYIFGNNDKIYLEPRVCAYIVAELQKYSLLDTDFDYKGQAYEEIVGANSRGERGEFFTPRNLCKLAVAISLEILKDRDITGVKILDPACGTGGFLRTYVHRVYSDFYKIEKQKWKDVNRAREKTRDRLKSYCDKNVFGIDFNQVLVRAAQMNLVMHGDGSTNIYHDNSLLSWGEWKEEVRKSIQDNSFDLIVTNPPFGEDLAVDDSHILDQYEISNFESKKQRTIMTPQELFIEKCYKLLKSNGLIAIVTPDSIVTNPSYVFIRHWILLKFRIIASIALPTEMFEPSTGTQTSLLVMRKRDIAFSDIEELKKVAGNEHVFISSPRKIGHDLRGNDILLRDPTGDIIYHKTTRKKFIRDVTGNWKEDEIEIQEPVIDDDLPRVYADFVKWFKQYGDKI